MFIVALFTITKIWKQPKRPSTDVWLKQLWDIYTMEYHSAIKKKILPFVTAWMDLEKIKWNKPIRQRQIPYDFTVEANEKTVLTRKTETGS